MTKKFVVTGDHYRMINFRMRKILWQLDQKGGSPLDPDAVAKILQQIVEGRHHEDGDQLPTEMTVGDRTYDILGFLEGNEKSVFGHVMVARAKEKIANLGRDDGEHILKYQDEIPVALRGKVLFVFPDWRPPDSSGRAYAVYWDDDCWGADEWVRAWRWLGYGDWGGNDRLLRRK